jgi:hypothetical protein
MRPRMTSFFPPSTVVVLAVSIRLCGAHTARVLMPTFDVDWGAFLSRADMTSVWTRDSQWSSTSSWVLPGPPLSYNLAAFGGNGNVGYMVQATENGEF